jgi:hypothetical protein
MRHDIGRLLHHLTVAPDAVARQVGADVEIDAERGDLRIADVGHADDRTRLWVELAKSVKRRRELFGQDREIALDETVGDAGRGGGHAGAAGQARLQARKHLRLTVATLLFLRQTDNHRRRSVPRQVVLTGPTMKADIMHPQLFWQDK